MPDIENRFIELLPRRDRVRLLGIREPVELVVLEVLCKPGTPTVTSISRLRASSLWSRTWKVLPAWKSAWSGAKACWERAWHFAASAACPRFHLIGPRLACWLLMSQDRACNDSFHVTHEFLGFMLGVRRVGITSAAGSLQRSGLIKHHRGDLTVLDRDGLGAAACRCYVADRDAYRGLLGVPTPGFAS